MPVIRFCPSCWQEVQANTACPACGADLQAWDRASYDEKLIRALEHPEPTVPLRAATILGERGCVGAVEPLMALARSSRDPYLQEAAAEALGRLGDPRARATLERLVRDAPLRVRLAARQALTRLARETAEDPTNDQA
jgi:HEAT repeat protein